jgi:hypothetical protein
MENSLVHFSHAVIIGVVLYVVMIYGLKQTQEVAQDRSVLISALMLAYMVLYGHGYPSEVNKNILS